MSIPDTFLVFKGTPSGKLVGTYVPRKKPEGAQVLVEIHSSGFCYTDVHYLQQDMVLGHEGVGVVKELGPMTRSLKMCVYKFPQVSSVSATIPPFQNLFSARIVS
jgi:threonine dehydrogenase-like Zn-dependent dehydrogenase